VEIFHLAISLNLCSRLFTPVRSIFSTLLFA